MSPLEARLFLLRTRGETSRGVGAHRIRLAEDLVLPEYKRRYVGHPSKITLG